MKKSKTAVIASPKGARQSTYARLLRRPCLLAMTMIIFLTVPTILFAGPFQKLKRGVSDVFVCPLEIPKHMIKAATQANPEWTAAFHGIFYGIPKGVGFGLARGVSGVLDIATFPLNIPKNWGSLFHLGPFSFGETKESVLQDRS